MDKDSLIRECMGYIRERPRMYLPRESLRLLNVFFIGFSTALDFAHADTPPASQMSGFFRWVRLRYKAEPPTDWDDAIIAVHNGDDRAAFDSFFQLWDEYLNEEARSDQSNS